MSNRILAWTDEAWDNYIYWQNQDRKTLKKINKIIKICPPYPSISRKFIL
ncbi:MULTISPECIES: type II toxin-antitoxin system YoeB family toxin [Planktothrix]|nr:MULTISPECIES: type II toxin-antitoxin system YoeB family toxin [Planktothrix]MCF3607172.1 type II toxin-antitoxin system YoeB family toxin [Planktothrix agardhii 1033]MCB8751341.1 type II toxin-antitoxin system YoeB family toxin [Planktothrix agardhii 1810]MCB8760187.1 type II toxin-antitoxin system YoeB family toxin [Planktothrix agardhii 1813]MCB8764026.1 type II toxin-antitoxin system YoeB family toxin [Planktothrix agardhii 1809]MCB8777658.1 type II toxin-antitoxin system YoeB family to